MSNKTISISPNRILIQHKVDLWKLGSYMATKFDTELGYLMTDTAGNLKAGGYSKCPTFYGRSSDPSSGIGDKDNGWWPTDLVSGAFNYSGQDIYLDIPRWDQYKQVVQTSSGFSRQYFSSYQTIYMGNTPVGTFRWTAAYVPVGTDSEGGTYYNMAVWVTNVSLWSGAISGVFRFPYVNIDAWTATLDYGDGPFVATFGQYEKYQDEGGGYFYRYPSPVFNNFCLMFLKNSVTLSISVTR